MKIKWHILGFSLGLLIIEGIWQTSVKAQIAIGGFFIKNELSNRCLDVSGSPGINNASRVQLWDCEESGFSGDGAPTDQKWEFTAGGFLKNVLSNKCLDVVGDPATANGSSLQLWDCELAALTINGIRTDQRWGLIAGGYITNLLSNKCLDVAGDPATLNGSSLQLWDCELTGLSINGFPTDQKWRLVP
ncbi:MAG: RICIN domain-containing protein [Nostoc sp. ChiSLP02]|nr:RICIN domain-containing protein [Nostoc sp. DedSLP05]MDZ8100964.1 RICIN domain-containing protein [Nostoc sp. DedSLP01]MDZ8189484.1 RICIN domain-containing protein [Nostoc sp. ChiSLP02]